MNKSAIVFKREFLTRVRTKGFVIGTVIAPLLMALMIFLPAVLMQTAPDPEQRIAVIDDTGRLLPLLAQAASDTSGGGGAPYRFLAAAAGGPEGRADSLKALNDRVLEGGLNVLLVLPAEVFTSNRFEMYVKNTGNFQLNESLNSMVSSAVSRIRLTDSGLDPERVEKLSRRVRAKTFKVAEGGAKEESGELAFLLSYIMVFMIYMSLVFYGTFVMRGVIEDKQSRVVEVLLSSARPGQLMTGKVLGIGAAGLLQMAIWGLMFFLVTGYGLAAVKQFAPAAQGLPLPSLSPWTALAFVTYFLLGYFLYAAVYAALGSMGNTESDMQSLQWPAIFPLIFALLTLMAVVKNPEGTFAVVMSLIPFFTPMIMFLRISLHAVPPSQVALSLVLTLLCIAGLIALSARIFRVGILMYGKRPTLPEALKWIKAR